jgi:hypothetical protein
METICYLWLWETFFAINFIELAISNVISITACLFFRVNFTHVLNDLSVLVPATIATKEPFLPLAFYW